MPTSRKDHTDSQQNRRYYNSDPRHDHPFSHGQWDASRNPAIGIDPDGENIRNISIAEASAVPGNDLKQQKYYNDAYIYYKTLLIFSLTLHGAP